MIRVPTAAGKLLPCASSATPSASEPSVRPQPCAVRRPPAGRGAGGAFAWQSSSPLPARLWAANCCGRYPGNPTLPGISARSYWEHFLARVMMGRRAMMLLPLKSLNGGTCLHHHVLALHDHDASPSPCCCCCCCRRCGGASFCCHAAKCYWRASVLLFRFVVKRAPSKFS